MYYVYLYFWPVCFLNITCNHNFTNLHWSAYFAHWLALIWNFFTIACLLQTNQHLCCTPHKTLMDCFINYLQTHKHDFHRFELNRRCCCNETPPSTWRNLDSFYPRIRKNQQNCLQKTLSGVCCMKSVHAFITSTCWSHRIASSFAGILHDRVFL